MAKGKGKSGMLLLVTTIIGIGLLSFGMIQLNFDLSFIGFDITGNVTALAVPEIDESNQRLLGAKAFVGDGNVIETAQRFAIGELIFHLENPTVITDFTIRIATEDPDVEVKGFIWLDPSSATSFETGASTPQRIALSPDVFNGTEIGTVLKDVTFTFPQALVLEPRQNFICENPPICEPFVPLQYIVGIRVDNNLAGSFTYAFNSTESYTIPDETFFEGGIKTFPETHKGVIDRNVAFQSEINFDPIDIIGVLGIDIFHNAQFGQELMEELEETLMENSTATEEEQLTACIAIFPPPPECVGDDPLAPQECGVAEDLIQGVCVCKDGFTAGVNPITDEDTCFVDKGMINGDILPQLQVPPRIDPIVFLGAGGVILVGSLIGIGVRTIRK